MPPQRLWVALKQISIKLQEAYDNCLGGWGVEALSGQAVRFVKEGAQGAPSSTNLLIKTQAC